MSEFKFEPKPPPEIPEDAGWDDTLRRALKKDGIEGSHVLQGYWENACEQAEEDFLYKASDAATPLEASRYITNNLSKVRESAVNSLIDNLNDMPKEDAITTLVDLYAEKVL